MRYYLCFLLSIMILSTSWSQNDSLNVNIEINDEDGIFQDQNTIQVFLTMKNDSYKKIDFTTQWTILTDDWKPLKTVTLTHSIKQTQQLRIDCPLFQFPKYGFYRIQAVVTTSSNQTSFERVIGLNPEEINAPVDKKEDFDAYWKNALDELSNVKPQYNLIPIPRDDNTKTNLFKVEMKSYLGKTVRGWLEVPKKEGVYPTLLRVPGYQENMEPIDVADDLIVFSFNTRDHGESDDSEGARNWDMWVRGFESKDNYYYKGLFLDCIRAIDFLTTRPDVDPSRIAIWGGSQGGGLSLSTAALDSRIALCIADIPYMCEYPKYFAITYWQEVSTWFKSHPEATWKTILHTLSYFDTKNFANKIKCPVWMGIGLQDDICPPATSFVAYNKVTAEKNYVVYKNSQHWQPEEHYQIRFKQLRQFFKMDN
jgi:cephalosporin-C deacetylase